MIRFNRAAIGVLLMALPLVARAADDGRFTLGKAVPSGVYMYIHGVHNPEREYLEKYWGEVWKAFKDAGVIEDVHTLIGSSMEEGQRADFEKFWSKAKELINGVDWDARVQEAVMTGRMSAPVPEYLVLIRYEEGKAEKNADAFAAVLKEIAAAVGKEEDVAFATAESHGAKISTLSFPKAPFLNLRVAVRGPVVAVAMDRTLLDEAFARLAGEGDKPGLIESDRFKQAMAKLPPPEDAVTFVDFKEMFAGIRTMFQFILSQNPQDAHATEALDVMGKVLDEFSLFDYVASTSQTDGYKEVSEAIVSLSPDAQKSRLYKVFKPEPLEKFDRFIPKEATAYSVFSGFDMSALYAGVLDFIDKETKGGKDLLAQWEKVQQDVNFNPERDIFSWLGGQMISVTLPSASPSPFSNSDSVVLIKVRDEKKAAEKIKAGLDKLNDLLTGMQQPLTSQPAGVEGAEGFRMVTHPLVMMFLRPVYGVSNGYLIIGSSTKAIEACLATARGERPSVAQNERVQKEGLVPKGPVASASFQDMTSLGKNISQIFNAMGMFSAMIPNKPELKPVRGLIGIAGKLGPVAEKIDFIRSSSSMSTFEGNAWHSKTVTSYRPPEAKATPEPAAGK